MNLGSLPHLSIIKWLLYFFFTLNFQPLKWGKMESNHPNPKATDLQSAPLPSTEYFPLCDSRLDYLCRRAFTSITAGFHRAFLFSVRNPPLSHHPGATRPHASGRIWTHRPYSLWHICFQDSAVITISVRWRNAHAGNRIRFSTSGWSRFF